VRLQWSFTNLIEKKPFRHSRGIARADFTSKVPNVDLILGATYHASPRVVAANDWPNNFAV
jgi:hypothetical protein